VASIHDPCYFSKSHYKIFQATGIFQYHIIVRIEDIMNLKMGDLRSYDKFDAFALQTKLSWNKNTMEKHSCPDQMLIGASGTYFCILLDLACYLESRLSNKHHGRYLFGDRDDNMEPDSANSRYCNALLKCWTEPEFVALLTKLKVFLGLYSNRKFLATWCA
jgi:hypothetical protein